MKETTGRGAMGSPFIGEIRAFAFDFVPTGWALCNGALQSIASNQALFALIGPKYGGNGETDFALPNLPGIMSGGVETAYYIALAGTSPPR
jgi:microcystin-dependent protein